MFTRRAFNLVILKTLCLSVFNENIGFAKSVTQTESVSLMGVNFGYASLLLDDLLHGSPLTIEQRGSKRYVLFRGFLLGWLPETNNLVANSIFLDKAALNVKGRTEISVAIEFECYADKRDSVLAG